MKQNLVSAGGIMTEPATSAAAAAGIKFGLGLGAGAMGALAMAAFDPPATRRALFAQAFVAGVCALMGTPIAVRFLDYTFDAIDLANATPWDAMEVVLPAGFMIGALSWGLMGALAKLRDIVRQKGAKAIADKVGLGVDVE